jgi:peptidyl-prolyl cis-trans isomerase D
MLDYIRSNAQSWGVKAAFGIIILVFVFWGVGRMDDTRASVVAVVNGEALTARELFLEMQRLEENIRANYPGISSEQLRAMNLQAQAEQALIVDTLLRQEAKRTGFAVTALDLRRVIEKNPAFHNEKGEFDPAAYLRVLEQQRTTPGQYESRVGRELLQKKLYGAITGPVEASEAEARALFDFARERRQVSYLLFPTDDYLSDVTVGEDEIRAEYESGRAAFTLPATCDADYVPVGAKALARPDEVTREECADWYGRNSSSALTPERLRLRHILLLLAPDAPESEERKVRNEMAAISARIAQGEDFASLARLFSQDAGSAANGGDLGWIQRGDTVPAFEAAALALQPGSVSGPVRTEFGLHLVKMEEHEKERLRSAEEMFPEIREILARQKAAERLQDVLEQLIEANIVGTPLEEAARAQGLEVRNTGPADAAALQEKLGVDGKGVAALLASPVGTGPDTPLEVKDADGTSFIVARIRGATPEKLRGFDEVKEEIIAGIKGKKARDAALAAATRVRGEMRDGDPLPPALREKIVDAPPVGRMEAPENLGGNDELMRAVFAAQEGAWLEKAFAVDGGAVLLRLDRRIMPDEESWKEATQAFTASLSASLKQENFRDFVRLLVEKAGIERRNVDLGDMR